MKKRLFQKLCALTILVSGTFTAQAQEQSAMVNPVRSMNRFSDLNLAVGITRINTNHAAFNTPNGIYLFDKGHYLPAVDANFEYGWIWTDATIDASFMLRTGWSLSTRQSDVTNDFGSNLRFSEGQFQIPFSFGFRIPLRYARNRYGMYSAVEVYTGPYVATDIFQKLDDKDNIDADGDNGVFHYIRFGWQGEIALSKLNKDGYGHRFGIRTAVDFRKNIKLRDTKYGLYPYYYTVGVFYNLVNNYHRK